MPFDIFIHTKEFIDFVDRAKYFCAFLETEQNIGYREYLSSLQKQLIALYSFGQTLPEFNTSEKDIDEVDITDADIKDILNSIRNRLTDTFYWVVFDPTDHNDTEPGCGDIADDLGDTYKDLKTFLIGFADDDENVKQNALWHLKWSFDYHWDTHCADAIYALHYFMKRANPLFSIP